MINDLMQIQNMKIQIKNAEMQLDNIEMQMKNIGSLNIGIQINNMGIQLLNMGIQMINIGMNMPIDQNDIFKFNQNIQNIIFIEPKRFILKFNWHLVYFILCLQKMKLN